jgi:toxin-antitoxin system PIN domain toxin
MIALDTNLLIYAHVPGSKEHFPSRAAIERAFGIGTCGVSLPSLSEFWSVVTQPRIGKASSTLEEAKSFIEALTNDGRLKIWHPTHGFYQRLMNLAHRQDVRGVKIFDLQIALLAIENKAREIWTHDRNFIQLEPLKVYDPIS